MGLEMSDFWTWRGTVGRSKYFTLGVVLFDLKHLLDRIVAASVFGLKWSLFNYWAFGGQGTIDQTPLDRLRFYATLLTLAIPFIWVGVVMSLRRLRDIGWPLWLVAVFFLPFVNLLFFLLLSTIPSREAGQRQLPRARGDSRVSAGAVSRSPRSMADVDSNGDLFDNDHRRCGLADRFSIGLG